MTDFDLDDLADNTADNIAKGIKYLDTMQIAAGYRQGFIKALQIMAEQLDAKGVCAELVMGHDLFEISKLPW
jgi:hypothetical protein